MVCAQHGNGFKTVNSPAQLTLFPANLPPTLQSPTSDGPGQHGHFASEFGCVAMSSFESMVRLAVAVWSTNNGLTQRLSSQTGTLSSSMWGVHTAAFPQRNYACDDIIVTYWGKQDLGAV